jgi:hypothetical protein
LTKFAPFGKILSDNKLFKEDDVIELVALVIGILLAPVAFKAGEGISRSLREP